MDTETKKIPGLGERIKQRLRDLGKKQPWLAGKLKVTQPAISQIISRDATKYLRELATALDTPIEWLEYGTGPKENMLYEQNQPMPRGFTERVYTHADLENIYKSTTPAERAKFDAIYPLIKKEMDSIIEEDPDSGFVAAQQQNGKKN